MVLLHNSAMVTGHERELRVSSDLEIQDLRSAERNSELTSSC